MPLEGRRPLHFYWRLARLQVSQTNKYTGETYISPGCGLLNPTAPGGPLSKEVSAIRQGNNPRPKSLGRAIRIVWESQNSEVSD